jgi:hypothetical protein
MPGPRFESKDTPKICLGLGDGAGPVARNQQGGGGRGPSYDPEASAKRMRQIGVEYALSGGPPIPWTESQLKDLLGRWKGYGITIGNLMIGGFNIAIYGRPGTYEEIA